MFTKSLASIFFSDDKVIVSELDSSKVNIKTFATEPFSRDWIFPDKTVDQEKLSQLIKAIWHKNSFRSKDVGIVVPESLTFSKLMKLPKLSMSEVGEAVKWQAQEYLPSGTDNMVIDWKVLERTEEKTEILMVAIQKDILMSYVNSCVQAGLFPVSVEVPSVSLGNIVKAVGGFIIVFIDSLKGLVISGEGNKIYGTSITDDNKSLEITSTVIKTIKHFNKVDFKTIYLGGTLINSEIVESLKKIPGLEIKIINPNINSNKEIIQRYLIPISMLKSPISEPLDPRTINLLPANLVEKYQNQKMRDQIWSLTLTVTVFVWVSLIVVLGSYLVLMQQTASLKAKSLETAQAASELRQIEKDSLAINKISDMVLKIKNSSVFPEVILNNIFISKPQGVEIVDYDLDLDKGAFILRGKSVDRQSLVKFKENLEQVTDFTSVEVPISSFEKVDNLEFSITFSYTPLAKESQNKPKR